LFMGSEIGQTSEWDHNASVQWDLLAFDYHRKLETLARELNRLYRSEPALYEVDFHHSGFEWVDFHDADSSIIAFLRKSENGKDSLLFCCNFTPVPRQGYRFGVPEAGFYEEILNSDSEFFGGSNMGNGGIVSSEEIPQHGRPNSIALTLPPLAVVGFKKR
jgi:1,4-alpha-glucan branching enzyme